MAAERNTRREVLKKLVTFGPLAALAGAFGANGAKTAQAQTYNENVIINNPYRLGIGTGSPGSPLHAVAPAGNNEAATFEGSSGNQSRFHMVDHTGSGRTWMVVAGAWDPGKFGVWDANAGAYRLIIDTNGNVGLGPAAPAARLDVAGAGRLSGDLTVNGTGNSSFANGKVGVGTPAPGSRLHVVAPSGNNEAATFEGSPANQGRIHLVDRQGAGRTWMVVAGAWDAGKFGLWDDGAGAYRLIIDTNGNVGIGTTAPAARLDVAGDIHVSGILIGSAQTAYFAP